MQRNHYNTDYETVAASQTNQVLGPNGKKGDILERLLIVPANTSPGNVQIKDGSNSPITVFVGGASSVSNLIEIPVELGARSRDGAWQVTTGVDVSVIAVGQFS